MTAISYRANKKRQPLAKLALESNALPDLNDSKVNEVPPPVKARLGRPPKDPSGNATALLGIRITPAKHDAYKAAAAAAKKSLTDWVLEHLDHAAEFAAGGKTS